MIIPCYLIKHNIDREENPYLGQQRTLYSDGLFYHNKMFIRVRGTYQQSKYTIKIIGVAKTTHILFNVKTSYYDIMSTEKG